MSATITIRADDRLRAALARRAAEQGRTISQVVREILENALIEAPLHRRVGHLKGALTLREGTSDAWRRSLRRNNWRA